MTIKELRQRLDDYSRLDHSFEDRDVMILDGDYRITDIKPRLYDVVNIIVYKDMLVISGEPQ